MATLSEGRARECSASVRERVERARAVQRSRYERVPGVSCNARAPVRWSGEQARGSGEALRLLAAAAERLGFTARAYHRVLKVARTIADLDGETSVGEPHVAEALRYRPVV